MAFQLRPLNEISKITFALQTLGIDHSWEDFVTTDYPDRSAPDADPPGKAVLAGLHCGGFIREIRG